MTRRRTHMWWRRQTARIAELTDASVAAPSELPEHALRRREVRKHIANNVRKLFSTLIVTAVLTGGSTLQAQTAPAAPQKPTALQAPTPPAPPILPEELATPPSLMNVRVDITVLEEGGAQPPTRKTSTVITADRREAAVRAIGEADVPGRADAFGKPQRMTTFAKADVRPWIERDGRIRTRITLEYLSPTSQMGGRGTTLQMEPLLESGKSLRVSESTDPTSERKVTIEVTATILK